ncbi:unnamed protein product [Mucor hiemalis]
MLSLKAEARQSMVVAYLAVLHLSASAKSFKYLLVRGHTLRLGSHKTHCFEPWKYCHSLIALCFSLTLIGLLRAFETFEVGVLAKVLVSLAVLAVVLAVVLQHLLIWIKVCQLLELPKSFFTQKL